AVIAFFVIFFMGGPLQEEFGWRGFATDRLQEKFNALWASIIMGILWAVWHLPLLFIPREESYYNRPAWGLFLTTTLVTILFTWIYNNTNRSIFATLIFHTMFNWSNFFFPTFETDIGGLLFFGLTITVVVVIVRKFGQERLRRENN
ncbi:MAG: CPBP family intramembrane metalloprotease, partial [Anaerolineae bacterium]|nr:CPBP family intramembrane metalloprotease [Anaerolineae bacterium]